MANVVDVFLFLFLVFLFVMFLVVVCRNAQNLATAVNGIILVLALVLLGMLLYVTACAVFDPDARHAQMV
jgi:hypothetical protein